MKFVGTASFDIIRNIGTSWQEPKVFYRTPIPGIGESPMFLSAIGSACASSATISYSGIEYVGAVNFIRQDLENNLIAFNLDKYILSPMKLKGQRLLEVYLEPKQLTPDHVFTPHSSLFNSLNPYLKAYIQRFTGKLLE